MHYWRDCSVGKVTEQGLAYLHPSLANHTSAEQTTEQISYIRCPKEAFLFSLPYICHQPTVLDPPPQPLWLVNITTTSLEPRQLLSSVTEHACYL